MTFLIIDFFAIIYSAISLSTGTEFSASDTFWILYYYTQIVLSFISLFVLIACYTMPGSAMLVKESVENTEPINVVSIFTVSLLISLLLFLGATKIVAAVIVSEMLAFTIYYLAKTEF